MSALPGNRQLLNKGEATSRLEIHKHNPNPLRENNIQWHHLIAKYYSRR